LISNLNFAIAQGQILGIVGPEGAGKTILLEILAGKKQPSSGELTVAGFKPDVNDSTYSANVKLISGEVRSLWPELSVKEVLPLIRQKYKLDHNDLNEYAADVAQLLGITDLIKVQSRKLNPQNKLKCELLLALMTKPQVLLLDDIFVGLEEGAVNKLKELITWIHGQWQLTTIVTSDKFSDMEQLVDAVGVMHKGSFIYSGTLAELADQHANFMYLNLSFEKNYDTSMLTMFGHILKAEGLTATLLIPREMKGRITSELLQKLPVKDMQAREMTSAEIVERIIKSQAAPEIVESV
jgi:ABC-2 type transport system ATP-binding protein